MLNTTINTYREVTTGTNLRPDELVLAAILLAGPAKRAASVFKLRPDELELKEHLRISQIIIESRQQMGNYKPDRTEQVIQACIKREIPNLAQRFARAVKSALID
ncbi:MAG: hypothetical protein NTX63_03420 [Candidatus Peregrinibacteria bacterium]|nr:hypothetical protein [Candidatus Peregrinibacteria bacterium]